MEVSDLPAVNAALNGLSATFLILGYLAIRKGERVLHQRLMIAAFTSSVLFLACYLTYHVLTPGVTRFLEPSWFRPYYLGLLLTHTVLAALVVPLVILTLYFAARRRFDAHRRVARWTWPIWMYVSVTGVAIYLLLYQIFPQT